MLVTLGMFCCQERVDREKVWKREKSYGREKVWKREREREEIKLVTSSSVIELVTDRTIELRMNELDKQEQE